LDIKLISEIQEFQRLFTPEHLRALEKVCEVWRKNITNDALIEQFCLGKRAVYIAIKEKMEADIEQLKLMMEQNQEDDR